jgi:hypothetical protein
MLFVGERRQSRRLPGAIRSERSEQQTGKNTSTRSSFVRRRAIPDARSLALRLLALCLFARSARCDVRWLPPSSSDLANGKALFRQFLLQIGVANIACL